MENKQWNGTTKLKHINNYIYLISLSTKKVKHRLSELIKEMQDQLFAVYKKLTLNIII
jgi:hypothetical protein